jgi:uncharacterized integral membrane protein
MQLLTIIAMLFTIGGVAFSLQNNVPVTVSFMLWRFDSSLALVLLIALTVGALIVALISTPGTLRRQWKIVRQQKRIGELEARCRDLELRQASLGSPEPVETLDEPSIAIGLGHLISGKAHPENPEREPARSPAQE